MRKIEEIYKTLSSLSINENEHDMPIDTLSLDAINKQSVDIFKYKDGSIQIEILSKHTTTPEIFALDNKSSMLLKKFI